MYIILTILTALLTYTILMNTKLKKELAKAKIKQLIYKSEIGQIPRDYEKEEECYKGIGGGDR